MAQVVVGAEAGATVGASVGGPPGAVIGLLIGGGVGILVTIGGFILAAKSDGDKAKKKAMEKKDPKVFRDEIKKVSQEFIVSLQSISFHQTIQKKDKVKDIMFIGITSAGKSSLINSLFGTKLQIGLGKTTNETSLALSTQQMRVWDSVGQNSDFQFYDIDKLALIHAMDTLCILYRSTPSSAENLIRLICSYKNAKYKVLFVRTCCDQWNQDHMKTLDEEVVQDYKILESLQVTKPIIYKTSMKKPNLFQNQKLKKDL